MIKDVLQRLESLQAVDLKVREIEKMREVIPGKIAELLGETRGKEAELAKVEAKVAEVDRERRQLETNAIDYGARLQRLLVVRFRRLCRNRCKSQGRCICPC